MLRKLKFVLGGLAAIYVGIFMWANMHRTHIYYWPSPQAKLPLLWYSSQEAAAESGAEQPGNEAEEPAFGEQQPAGAGAARQQQVQAVTTRQARPVPVFLIVFACLVFGFVASWFMSAAVLAAEKTGRVRLQRRIRELEKQIDELQKVPPPAGVPATTAEGDLDPGPIALESPHDH